MPKPPPDPTIHPTIPPLEMLQASVLLLDDHLRRVQSIEQEIKRSRDDLAWYLDALGELPRPVRHFIVLDD